MAEVPKGVRRFALKMNRMPQLAKAVVGARRPYPVHDSTVHLRGAVEWLNRAQDAHLDGGCAKSFDLMTGRWEPSYPETTGYIIGTLLDVYRLMRDQRQRDRAGRMGRWLQTLQLDTGAFPALDRRTPVVFDTGQVLHGLLDLEELDRSGEYLESVRRAASWLTEIQEDGGSWRSGAYQNTYHAYCTRVAWALLRAARVLDEPRFETAAMRNLDWALTRQLPNGWFRNNGLHDDDRPLLHTIVYSARGLFESGTLMNEDRYRLAAGRTIEALYRSWQRRGTLHGAYDSNWRAVTSRRCLAGEAQLSVLWMRAAALWNEPSYRSGALALNRGLKQTQNLTSSDPGVCGAIAGSFPIYGAYCFMKFPNWAVKFFVDALLLERAGGCLDGLGVTMTSDTGH